MRKKLKDMPIQDWPSWIQVLHLTATLLGTATWFAFMVAVFMKFLLIE